MSRNVETVRRSLDAISVGDIEAVGECFTDDVVFDGSRIAEGTYAGKGRYLEFLEESRRANTYRFSGYTLLEDGDTVIALVDAEVVGETSGAAVKGRFGFLYRMRDGLICHQEIHSDTEQLLADSDLEPSGDQGP